MTKGGTFQNTNSNVRLHGGGFLGPEPALGVSRRDIKKRLNRWLTNQHWARWRCLGGTQRQAQELISGPGRDAKAKLMSFNRTQSRAVIGLLTGRNNLRIHLHILGLTVSPLCRKCGVKEETSAHYYYYYYYYYYRYSALGPVWAETRAQSVDWYAASWASS